MSEKRKPVETEIANLRSLIGAQAVNVNHLVEAVATVSTTTDHLAASLDQRPTKRQFWFVGVGLAVMFAVIIVIGLVNRSGVERLKDCTTVGGECYSASQAGQQDVVGALTFSLKCQNIGLINEFSQKNRLNPIEVPEGCVATK